MSFATSIVTITQGCSVAMWLVRWAAVRQSRVRFPPGTPPSAQQEEKLFAQMQESPLTQLRKKEHPTGEHPEEE
jgi:hypothetical protein